MKIRNVTFIILLLCIASSVAFFACNKDNNQLSKKNISANELENRQFKLVSLSDSKLNSHNTMNLHNGRSYYIRNQYGKNLYLRALKNYNGANVDVTDLFDYDEQYGFSWKLSASEDDPSEVLFFNNNDSIFSKKRIMEIDTTKIDRPITNVQLWDPYLGTEGLWNIYVSTTSLEWVRGIIVNVKTGEMLAKDNSVKRGNIYNVETQEKYDPRIHYLGSPYLSDRHVWIFEPVDKGF